MKSIYKKILIWASITLVISMTLCFAVTRSIESHLGISDLFIRVQKLELEQVRAEYESGGQQRVAAFLDRLNRSAAWHTYAVGPDNHDLATGADRASVIAQLQGRWARPTDTSLGTVFAIRTPDNKYALLVGSTVPFDPWTMLPYYGLILLTIALLCWPLAWHINSPLRSLARTVDRFGQGDLSTRARSKRRDEIGELARSFDRMADRLETLLTAERRLLQDVSHELRSPLARLSFAAALLNTEPDRQKAEGRIQKEVGRLSTLVGSLLEMTRAEGDPASRQFRTIQIQDLLRDVVDDCSVEAAARSCSISIESSEPAAINGDEELIRRAFENVLRNAIRYSPERETVSVRLESSEGSTKIEVRDRGPGVPEEQLSEIFQPFVRVDDSRNNATGGIGLGLAIAMRAVRLHNGWIEAKNAEPGLRIRIGIPQTAL
jgi:two-component system sensor histidine kinase CpxA